MKIHNLPQGTPEWFEVRRGKMTASNASCIAVNGKGLETYIRGLMAEYYSTAEKENINSKDTERGHELEPIAREIYEMTKGEKVDEVGFMEYDEYLGCSPDGLVGEDGGIEIKSLNDSNHFSLLLDGIQGIDPKYIWQIQMTLLITGRKWWDYVSYNPNFQESLIVHRIYPDTKAFESLTAGIMTGKKRIREIIISVTPIVG